MKNKENKYREELFNLLKPIISEVDDNKEILELLNEIFITNHNDLDIEEIKNRVIKSWIKLIIN